jgi:hypothetical protein
MLTLLYYIFIWPLRLLIGSLIDDVLVLFKLKYVVPIGLPVWRKHLTVMRRRH